MKISNYANRKKWKKIVCWITCKIHKPMWWYFRGRNCGLKKAVSITQSYKIVTITKRAVAKWIFLHLPKIFLILLFTTPTASQHFNSATEIKFNAKGTMTQERKRIGSNNLCLKLRLEYSQLRALFFIIIELQTT